MHTSAQLPRIAFLLACSFFSSCQDAQKDKGKTAEQIKDYPVLTLAPRSITTNSEYPATIEGQQDIEIRPKIDGFIEKIFVDEGATVKRGQPIFRINAPQYEQEVRTAEANIKISQADVNAAKMGVNKVRPLVEKNIISKYELESAEFTLEAKQASLAQAYAALSNARTNLGYTIIASPANGIIGSIPYKIGSLVNSNTPEPLTTISNIGNIYAYFSINEKQVLDFSKNTKGATTQARLATMPPVSLVLANGTVFPQKGRIETTSGSINTETGSVRVRATFPNPGSIVRSGSSAIVRIPSRLDSAIVIPQKATYEIQGKKFVYRVAADGSVKSAEVGVRENSDGQFFIAQSGLAAGDKIVLEGVASLREGAKILPKPVAADSVYAQKL
ncbi:efflux RND transporter periplasmic adaptor subunit [Dyadobacter sp. CY323]|uniref:efflux RND transporter periplasmic adaptor subunit n=1 Tax=Dyadobacter sp. CY323 TaxID=2907302 RepID=UPI001F363B90|nr:efflux RND transporter periplasmic adaptor subunit [Dyadobacter sp. CY323]MCE6992474.1 efflux RND transporter periplasmic adaptor subunit [Dyadobacter sp. CY323]